MPNVLIVRGQLATPWELVPWRLLPERFDVGYLSTPSNTYDVAGVGLQARPVRMLRDRFPRGRAGDILSGVLGERYLDAADSYSRADIVHAEELSFWFAADAARHKAEHGYRLVQTVWETIPFLRTYRSRHARAYRDAVLEATDLFLPATERAADALRLEGVADARIRLCSPGIDIDRFAAREDSPQPAEHTILSPGRLVYEKGHQDVLRAVAALDRGLLRDRPAVPAPRVRIIGSGPEEGRLRAYAAELGIAERVSFGSVSYDDMPAVYRDASCMVLASLPAAGGGFHPFDVPRIFWEEQFGLVLAEAMAAGLDVLAAQSGAIPEVVGESGTYFLPGDYMGLARLLAEGPLSRPPGARVAHPEERVAHYSTTAMAGRLADAYDAVLA